MLGMLIANIIFGIILLLVTIYIVVYYIYQGPGNMDILQKMTRLNEKIDIYNADVTQKNILATSGSTVMGFFNIQDGNKTLNYSQNFTPILQVENNWFLEIASANTSPTTNSAQLRVYTNSGAFKYEIIPLPPIPKQKWVFIAILRDGRRFDIIYDNKIVASDRLEYYPVVISSPLAIGNTGLNGSVIHIIINSTRLSPNVIESTRIRYVDTNNKVLEANQIGISLPGLNLFAQCPPGLPCNPITQPPNNNLLQWKTPYA
jgi:hypothetical protein